jgi:hypothetical protein
MEPEAGPSSDAETETFYRDVIAALNAADAPYLVGGAYGAQHYTGIIRDTKDLDLFVRRRDLPEVFPVLEGIGCRTEVAFPHWLAKAHRGSHLVDLIYNSGNAVAVVDDEWFRHAVPGNLLGLPVRVCPAEEIIWSKAFILERERYDGADVAHLLRAEGRRLSWPRLLARFDEHWPVLLVHLILFGFIYPGARDRIPAEVMDDLLLRLERQRGQAPPDPGVCRGTLLSRAQYLVDVEEWGLQDARLGPETTMTSADREVWTDAIAEEMRPRSSQRS